MTKWNTLKREIGLRAYGQHDPVLEYRNVGSELYENMLDSIKKDTVRYVLSAMPRVKIEREQVAKPLDTGGDGSLGNTPKRAKKNPAETTLAHAAAVRNTRTAAVRTNNLNKPYGFLHADRRQEISSDFVKMNSSALHPVR